MLEQPQALLTKPMSSTNPPAMREHNNVKQDKESTKDNKSPCNVLKLPPALDETDATSLATASTSASPSPFSDGGNRSSRIHDDDHDHGVLSSSSAESSPSISRQGGGEDDHQQEHEISTTSTSQYSLLSSFTATTPLRNMSASTISKVTPISCPSPTVKTPEMTTPPSRSTLHQSHDLDENHNNLSHISHLEEEDSWSDSDDNDYFDDNEDGDIQTETPVRRTPRWSIQQALFPEEVEDSSAPTTIAEGTPRAHRRSKSNSTDDISPQKNNDPLIRTRRARRATSNSDNKKAVAHVQDDFVMPEHHRQRRHSMGFRKYRASPKPEPQPELHISNHASLSIPNSACSPPRRVRSTGNNNDAANYHHNDIHSQQQLQPQNNHYSSSQHFGSQPPALLPTSHSKSKRLKQQHRNSRRLGLELPGLGSLEDRLYQIASSSDCVVDGGKITGRPSYSASTMASSGMPATTTASASSKNNSSWRNLLCRLRVSNLIVVLIMVGATSLGRSILLTSDASSSVNHHRMDIAPKQKELLDPPTPTAGLRGSLLLATVGREARQSHSLEDRHQKKAGTDTAKKTKKTTAANTKKNGTNDKKKTAGNAKKNGTADNKKTTTKAKDAPVSSIAHTNDRNHKPVAAKKPKAPNTGTATGTQQKKKAKPVTKALPTQKYVGVAHPPPLDRSVAQSYSRRMFEAYDQNMFATKSATSSTIKNQDIPKRVVMLHDDIIGKSTAPKKSVRTVGLYPAEFTDNTQFYSQFESSDERLRKMEMREPYEQGECVPMQEWQTTFHPSCNDIHELGVEYLGEESTETGVQLFGTKGYWRYAWRLDLRKQQSSRQEDAVEEFGDRVVLKTLKYRHDFEDAHFEHDRIDAVAMERLTASPHVINVFGFCGHSVITEYANGPRLGELADKSRSTPLARLKIARDIATGLADVHGIDGEDGKNATFVHLDINPANVVSIGGTLKLNDFNIGIIRRWNKTAQEPCGFPAQYPNPQWRSPEEARDEKNLTEKVDVFSMGHIFFRLICGHEPWNKLEHGGKPSKDAINDKVKQGKLPSIPESVMNTDDHEVAAIRDAMLDCYTADATERPSAREIANKLEVVLEKLAGEEQ